MTDTVTLANGKTVSLDEFLTWNPSKQNNQLRPPNLGRIFGKEHKEKIINSRKKSKENGVVYKTKNGGDAPISRTVKTPNGIFSSIGEAARSHNVDGPTIRRRVEIGLVGYEFLSVLMNRKKPDPTKNKNSRKVKTPIGIFDTISQAASAYHVNGSTIRNWINNGKEGFLFLTVWAPRTKPIKPKCLSGKNNPSSRGVMTPAGSFDSLTQAAVHYHVKLQTIWKWVNKSRTADFRYLNSE